MGGRGWGHSWGGGSAVGGSGLRAARRCWTKRIWEDQVTWPGRGVMTRRGARRKQAAGAWEGASRVPSLPWAARDEKTDPKPLFLVLWEQLELRRSSPLP